MFMVNKDSHSKHEGKGEAKERDRQRNIFFQFYFVTPFDEPIITVIMTVELCNISLATVIALLG